MEFNMKEKLKSFLIKKGFKQLDDKTLTSTRNKNDYRIILNALSMRIERRFLIYQWNNIKEYKWFRLQSGYYTEISIIDEKIHGMKR